MSHSTFVASRGEVQPYPNCTRVYKEFPGHGWFSGTIVSWNGFFHHIFYTDGDSEDLTIAEVAQWLAPTTTIEEATAVTTEAPRRSPTSVLSPSSSHVPLPQPSATLITPPAEISTATQVTEAPRFPTNVNTPSTPRVTRQPSATLSTPPAERLTPSVILASIQAIATTEAVVFPATVPHMAQPFVLPATESDDDMAARKSKRQKVSTLVYVDGHAVKKSNNYVLKGGSYAYGVVSEQVDQAAASKKKRALQKAARPQQKRPPRVLSSLEVERVALKDKIRANICNKAAKRQSFLSEHAAVLEPFMDPAVLAKLKGQSAIAASAAGAVASDGKPAALYMQPEGITADMRDYQLDSLNWMSGMYERNMGMILGDEMGLGKTLQTIALVCHLKETHNVTGPTLVVCPLSVLYSWCNEITKWAPSLKFLRLHASATDSLSVQDMGSYDMIVTTYEMVKAPALKGMWSRQHFNLAVLDEGHQIKCATSQIAAAVRRIHCETRLLLTGTPLANNLVEMWSLLEFLVPDVFTTSQPFAEAFDLTRNVVDPVKLSQAHRVLKLFMLRRLKVEVEKLMPKKIETKVICPLSTMQIWWYKSLLLKDLSKVMGNSVGKGKVLSNLVMQLRKVCVHPFLFKGAEDPETTTLETMVGASGKLAVLDKLLKSLYKKGHRVTLFSQFTQVLDILDDYCALSGWKYCRFDGGTARAKRNFIVNDFNAPDSDKFLFLMSTRSGGMGLNLQTADTCILFDSDWNPQPDIQAMARIHRIGQTKTVHVYRLVTGGTVEERMIERAEKKLYLDRMVTRDGSSELSLDDEEDSNRLMTTLRFGCNAIFGEQSEKQSLPTDADIELITDRSRAEDFSNGQLKGGTDSSVNDFNATKTFTATTDFGGIDFKKIRAEYDTQKKAADMGHLTAMWKKRQRKNRIVMVDGMGSGYGSKAVPVLASNDYDLETGEKSVFDRELKGRAKQETRKKEKQVFEWQDFCQVCGDAGDLVLCPRCPVSVHVKCVGISQAKHFRNCTHHHCSVCEKSACAAGGILFPCSACPNSYCEDHLPAEARTLKNGCSRMEDLGFTIGRGVYVHCSGQCEHVAKTEFGWTPDTTVTAPCPPPLDVTSFFGGAVDDSVDTPEKLIVEGKRRRKAPVSYASSTEKSAARPPVYALLLDDVDGTAKRSPLPKKVRQSDVAYEYQEPEASDEEDSVIGFTAGVASLPKPKGMPAKLAPNEALAFARNNLPFRAGASSLETKKPAAAVVPSFNPSNLALKKVAGKENKVMPPKPVSALTIKPVAAAAVIDLT